MALSIKNREKLDRVFYGMRGLTLTDRQKRDILEEFGKSLNPATAQDVEAYLREKGL